MDNAVVGIYDCIHQLQEAINGLMDKGYQTEDMTLVTKETAGGAGAMDIPVIQVTEEHLIWELILEYVAYDDLDEAPEWLCAMKRAFMRAGKYVLLMENMEQSADLVPA